MFYKKYNITNDENFKDINILRFSSNPYTDNNCICDIKVNKLLDDLKNQAIKDELDFNGIYPWNDFDLDCKNREVIIAYNNRMNHIQGWCNISYSTFSIEEEPTNLYNLIVEKLVSREIPKIKYIGLLLLEFVRDECINKPILYYYNNPTDETKFQTYGEINIDIMYLYSLTTSISYYKNTFLTQLTLYNQPENDYQILEHVFIYLNEKYIGITSKRIRTYISKLNILHLFECNSILSPKSIMRYERYKPSKKHKTVNKKIIALFDIIDIPYSIKNRIYGSRIRDSIDYIGKIKKPRNE
jgi:hypothetical protein